MNEEYRINQLREYIYNILKEITTTSLKVLNVNFLDNDVEMYSLNKIPTQSVIKKDRAGIETCKDVYNFFSKKNYSVDVIENLDNMGFFEKFEETIRNNNKKKILPKIKNIKKIECLNCGALQTALNNECIFSIQIQITYWRL